MTANYTAAAQADDPPAISALHADDAILHPLEAFMATGEVAQAMEEDHLKIETVRVLREVTP